MQHAFFVLFCLKTEIFSLCLTYRPHVSGETLFFGYEKGDCHQKHSFSKSPSRVEILLKRRRIVYVGLTKSTTMSYIIQRMPCKACNRMASNSLSEQRFVWTGENDSPNMRRHVFFFHFKNGEKNLRTSGWGLNFPLLIFRFGLLWKDNLSQTTAHRLWQWLHGGGEKSIQTNNL